MPGQPVPTRALLHLCLVLWSQSTSLPGFLPLALPLCLSQRPRVFLLLWFAAFHLCWSTASPLPAVARVETEWTKTWPPMEQLWLPVESQSSFIIAIISLPLSAFSVAESREGGGRECQIIGGGLDHFLLQGDLCVAVNV